MFDAGLQTRTREFIIDGRRLEVALHSPIKSSGTPIVLLHEGLGSVAQWKDYPERLAERTKRTVVAYSRYGHGGSEVLHERRDVDYMHREGEAVLPELLAQLDIVRPVLYGHSDGASIALIYAGTYRNATAALVLEAPHVFVEDVSVRSIEAARDAFATTSLPEKLGRYHTDPARTFRGWNDVWLDPRFRGWNIEAYARRVTCSILMVQGTNDEYGTAAQLAAIAAVTQSTVVLLDDCGHSPHRDRADATLDAVTQFLNVRECERP